MKIRSTILELSGRYGWSDEDFNRGSAEVRTRVNFGFIKHRTFKTNEVPYRVSLRCSVLYCDSFVIAPKIVTYTTQAKRKKKKGKFATVLNQLSTMPL
jgi:hypothetical protein